MISSIFPGVVFQNGTPWERLRRVVLQSMRNFGVGRPTIERRIEEETDHVLSEIDATRGAAFDPKAIFQRAVCNVICSVLFGQRCVPTSLICSHNINRSYLI